MKTAAVMATHTRTYKFAGLCLCAETNTINVKVDVMMFLSGIRSAMTMRILTAAAQ